MNEGRTVFAQLMEHAPHHQFRRCVERYRGNARVRRFRCWDQFLCMAFGQLTYRESLRDIEACLRALEGKLYHMGIRARVSRNTLAVANEKRDWRIYAEFAQILIHEARRLYVDEPFLADLEETVYALDSTTVDLCLSLFPWARFRTTKAAVKLVDQAAPADQVLLRRVGQRGEDPNLDRNLHLRAGRHPEETAWNRTQPLHNPTDPERQRVRENRAFTSIQLDDWRNRFQHIS